MNTLILFAHPNAQSFNRAVLNSFIKGLESKRLSYDLVDLYALNFEPCLSSLDLALFQQGKVPPDVLTQQTKVAWADWLVFIFPVWWSAPPAILKGWIDRVFSLKFAYDFTDRGPVGLLQSKKALLMTTTGGDRNFFESSGIKRAMEMTLDLGIFGFSGMETIRHEFFYQVVEGDEALRRNYLEKAFELGAGLEDQS
jgi:NAD(P)H dehydrogenase (quinone)